MPRCVCSCASIGLCAFLALSAPVLARPTAQGPAFTYQGVLKNADASYSGTADFEFRLYDAAVAGAPIGAMIPVNAVTVSDGRFSSTLDFGALVFNGEERWLEISVRTPAGGPGGFTILAPRQKLASAPYAAYALQSALAGSYGNAVNFSNIGNTFAGNGAGLTNLNASSIASGTLNSLRLAGTYSNALTLNNAGNVLAGNGAAITSVNADLLDGLDSSAFLQALPIPSLLVGSASPIVKGETTSTTDGAMGLMGVASGFSGATRGVFGRSDSPDGVGVDGLAGLLSGATTGVRGVSASPSGRGVYGENSSFTGVAHGVVGRSFSSSGAGVFGFNNNSSGQTFGVKGSSVSPTGAGVYGESTSATGSPSGVYGRSISNNGIGVFGITSNASGITWGMYGVSTSTSGRGVQGEAIATTGQAHGVMGTTMSSGGVGVRGENLATLGISIGVQGSTASNSGIGVFGESTAAGGTTFGVRGSVVSPNGYGGYFEGRGYFSGFLGIGTSFPLSGLQIDGPGYPSAFINLNSTGGNGDAGLRLGRDGVTKWHMYNAAGAGDVFSLYTESFSPVIIGTQAGNMGVGVGSPAARLHVEGSGADALLVQNSGTGRGATINSSSDTALWTTTTSGGAAIDARNYTGPNGVVGWVGAATGPTAGVRGTAASNNGSGVWGEATDAAGITSGGTFIASSTNGRGIFARATATSGTTYGGMLISDSTGGAGVLGMSNATTGANYGVYGLTLSPSSSAYAVWAQGNMGGAGMKSFRIDHPDDPANKYLLHYSSESPEVINFYRGNVTLNGAGEAFVDLPLYFAKINRDPSYVLTAVGAAMPNLHVADEISELSLAEGGPCWFRIAGGAPNGKVSWRVEAVRHDKWMQNRGAPVEVEKQGAEKGLYQHPEFYNQPPDKGMNWQQVQRLRDMDTARTEVRRRRP